jgi:DNA invertase Pin-like site-specific DNA recombinase
MQAVAFDRGAFKEMKRAAIYVRVSSPDQHPETQLCDLRPLAAARGYEIVGQYSDTISGSKAKRPGLDQLMSDARRGRFDVVMVWAFDRMARSVRHFLEILDELNHLGIEFVSFRENLDTGGPLARAMVIIVGAIAELEKSLIVERLKSGMRRARLEGRQIGRARLDVDRGQIICDRRNGLSLSQTARKHGISRASVCRIAKQPALTPDASCSAPREEQLACQ